MKTGSPNPEPAEGLVPAETHGPFLGRRATQLADVQWQQERLETSRKEPTERLLAKLGPLRFTSQSPIQF